MSTKCDDKDVRHAHTDDGRLVVFCGKLRLWDCQAWDLENDPAYWVYRVPSRYNSLDPPRVTHAYLDTLESAQSVVAHAKDHGAAATALMLMRNNHSPAHVLVWATNEREAIRSARTLLDRQFSQTWHPKYRTPSLKATELERFEKTAQSEIERQEENEANRDRTKAKRYRFYQEQQLNDWMACACDRSERSERHYVNYERATLDGGRRDQDLFTIFRPDKRAGLGHSARWKLVRSYEADAEHELPSMRKRDRQAELADHDDDYDFEDTAAAIFPDEVSEKPYDITKLEAEELAEELADEEEEELSD